MCAGQRPPAGSSPSSAWKNFTESDLPLLERVRLFGVNTWWKVSHRQHCCGHYGDPGC